MGKYRLNPSDLRSKSVEELNKLLADQRAQLISLRQKGLSGSIESPAKVREIRKNIARILTIIKEKSRSEATAKEGK